MVEDPELGETYYYIKRMTTEPHRLIQVKVVEFSTDQDGVRTHVLPVKAIEPTMIILFRQDFVASHSDLFTDRWQAEREHIKALEHQRVDLLWSLLHGQREMKRSLERIIDRLEQ